MPSEFKQIESVGSPIYGVSHRLFAVSDTGALASGTCVNISGNLVLTAKHVILDFNRRFGTENYELWVVQITNDDDLYAVWQCDAAICQTITDLALLRIKPYNEKAATLFSGRLVQHARLRLNPPSVGETVAAFGYASETGGTIVSTNNLGGPHFEINDRPMVTTGVVEEIHPVRRDVSLMNWPCYRVGFASRGGMSGGPVFDSLGRLCGIICTGGECADDTQSMAHITSLWPLSFLNISFDRGDRYPRGITYPFLELMRDDLVSAIDWQSLPSDTVLDQRESSVLER